ncbi:MAG: hypothetical protein QNJ54_34845 [Prochloraceae cyanobacterium]|nr:hypothetical protein [Prochloraceae cyanobacterium]
MFNYLRILYQTFALTAWSTAIIFIINDSINNSVFLPSNRLRFSLLKEYRQQHFQTIDTSTPTKQHSSLENDRD